MQKYSVVQAGLGPRGVTHLKGFLQNAVRMEIVGICDIARERVAAVGAEFSLSSDRWFYNAAEMLEKLRPDILSFCTLPAVRSEMIELAVRYGVKAVFLEKPMATSLLEAKKMTELCEEHQIKAVVCHQHKYLRGFQMLKRRIDSGELGEIQRINAECQPWLSQLGTHYMDYVIWANGGLGPVSVVGHVHGKQKLSDSHPSPDYMLGEMVLKNGVRSTIQLGYFTRAFHAHDEDYASGTFPMDFWEDDRLTVYGTTGYAWAECNGNWGAFTAATQGQLIGGKENAFHDEIDHPEAQAAYTREMIDWLDGSIGNHGCNIRQAYEGYDALEAICTSALDHRRVDLPMEPDGLSDVNQRMREELPEVQRHFFSRA